jgi:hypothetical protein
MRQSTGAMCADRSGGPSSLLVLPLRDRMAGIGKRNKSTWSRNFLPVSNILQTIGCYALDLIQVDRGARYDCFIGIGNRCCQ